MYVCMYVCTYIHIHTYVCMYMYIYIHIYIYTYMYVCMYTYIYICMFIYIYMYAGFQTRLGPLRGTIKLSKSTPNPIAEPHGSVAPGNVSSFVIRAFILSLAFRTGFTNL